MLFIRSFVVSLVKNMQQAYSRGRQLGSAKGHFSQRCSVLVNSCSGDTAEILYGLNVLVCLNYIFVKKQKNNLADVSLVRVARLRPVVCCN